MVGQNRGLRIDLSMRYNPLSSAVLSLKMVRTDVDGIYTHLTQPTDCGRGLGWYELYQPSLCPGGIHQGFLILWSWNAEPGCAHKQETNMNMLIQSRFIHNVDVVQGLERTRMEWQQAAEGESLLNMKANVGLLLVDMAVSIGLTSDEKLLVLGADLVNELQDTLLSIPGDNGNQ